MSGLYLDEYYKDHRYPTLYLYNKGSTGGYYVDITYGGVDYEATESIGAPTSETLIIPWEFL